MSSRRDIQSQSKKIIFNVYSYLKKLSRDSSHPEVAKFFIQTLQKTSEACGISLTTIKRITSEGLKAPSDSGTGPIFTSPRKTYKRIKYATDINDFDKDILRQTVHEFYDQGEFPTSAKILSKYQEKTGYKGSQKSLMTILKSLNFRYKKRNDGRQFLIEKNNVVFTRVQFLKKMVNLRQNNDVRPVVYLDKFDIPIGKRDLLIICHAVSSLFGFLKDSKLVFHCKSGSSEDYHTQMNYVIIKDWFIQILQSLKEPSIIVIDNAWYNRVHLNNYPKGKKKKINIQKWLNEKGVEFSPLETSLELRQRVKQLIPREKKNELNEIAFSMGYEVVRLPPYHYHYNPIKLIWAQVKEKLTQNPTLKIVDVEKLVNEALDSVSIDKWKSCVTLCNKVQDEDYVKEDLRDKMMKSTFMMTNPDNSNESEDQDSNC